jgi:multisite-specific tRNA:(cytosine-C5)-methyltransferase
VITDFELVDPSSLLPNLIRRQGRTSWTPAVDRAMHFFDSYDAYIDSLPGEKKASAKLSPGHWPPPADAVADLHLERWLDVIPYLSIKLLT